MRNKLSSTIANLFSRRKIAGWIIVGSGILIGLVTYFFGAGLNWSSQTKPIVVQPTVAQFYYFHNLSWLKKYPLVKIERINDGDTFEVFLNGKRERVRLLGINTPEIESQYRHRECFGPEASKRGKQLLTNQKVYLIKDPNVPNRGRYGRLLRYAVREDGLFYNAEMVWEGYAFEYSPKGQHFNYENLFKQLESQARNKKRGLWGKCKT